MEEIKVCQKEKLGVVQTKVNSTLSGGEGKIAKVLTLLAVPVVKSTDTSNADVKFGGEIKFSGAAYLESGELVEISATENFSMTFENVKVKEDSNVDMSCGVMDNVNYTIKDGEVFATALVSGTVFQVTKTEIPYAQGDSEVFVKESELTTISFKDQNTHSFVVLAEVDQADVVLKTFGAVIKSITPSEDYFTVDGEVVFNILTTSDGEIKNTVKTVPFSEEISSNGVRKNDIIQGRIFVCGEPTITSGENAITFELPLCVSYIVTGSTTISCIVDAYSIKNEIKLTTQSLQQTEFFATRYFEETVMNTISVADQNPPVDKVLAATGENINIINSYIKNNEGVIEGIASINIIYKGEEQDKEVVNSFIIDLPFTLNLPAAGLKDEDLIDASVIFGEITSKARKGQLETVVVIKVNCNYSMGRISAVVTSLEKGEEKLAKDIALEIYLVSEGQTLWDVGKLLNVATEELLNQNEGVALPLCGGEKLVIYRSLSDFNE